jgi:hypothetical protein
MLGRGEGSPCPPGDGAHSAAARVDRLTHRSHRSDVCCLNGATPRGWRCRYGCRSPSAHVRIQRNLLTRISRKPLTCARRERPQTHSEPRPEGRGRVSGADPATVSEPGERRPPAGHGRGAIGPGRAMPGARESEGFAVQSAVRRALHGDAFGGQSVGAAGHVAMHAAKLASHMPALCFAAARHACAAARERAVWMQSWNIPRTLWTQADRAVPHSGQSAFGSVPSSGGLWPPRSSGCRTSLSSVIREEAACLRG